MIQNPAYCIFQKFKVSDFWSPLVERGLNLKIIIYFTIQACFFPNMSNKFMWFVSMS